MNLSRFVSCSNVFFPLLQTIEKTVGLGNRMDMVFLLIRIGLFYMDHDLVTRNLDKAKQLLEEGGDWDRRNRLKVGHLL